jgi:phosphoglycolate phosphatase
VKACILDLDGTLVNTLGDFEAALNGMLRDLYFDPITQAQILPFIGKGSEHLVRETLKLQAHTLKKSHTLGQGYVQMAAMTSYMRHYGRINGQFSSVYAGVEEGLANLRVRGLRLACLTNKPKGFAERLLEQKGLLAEFEFVFGGDSFERKKPDPLPVIRTCEALQLEPNQVLCIGDSQNDADAAHTAGASVVIVDYGFNHGVPASEIRLADGSAPRIISSLEQA